MRTTAESAIGLPSARSARSPSGSRQSTVGVCGQANRLPDREPFPRRRDGGDPTLGRAGEDRPGRREAELPLGEESVRIFEGAQQGTEVRAPHVQVIHEEYRRPCLPPQAAQEPGQDLGHGEPPTVEPLVQVPQQRGGDSVGPPEARRPHRDDPRSGARRVRTEPVRHLARRPASHGARPAPRRPHDPHDPRRRARGREGIEPSDDLGHFPLAAEDHRGDPISGEDFGVGYLEHGTLYY